MGRLGVFWSWLTRVVLVAGLLLLPHGPAVADLRTPLWYDVNAVTTLPDWHYRVPINIPAGASIGSTIRLDVDFAALLATLGVNGVFDPNSWRVVRSNGALAAVQEFTDRVFAGATDAAGNSRGEVRFVLQDTGSVTYYLYFDVTANGAKPANTQTPINGNFEIGATGTASPVGWNALVKATATYDAEMRASETVSVTGVPAPIDGVPTRNTDGTPDSGAFAYLMGNRSATATAAGAPGATLSRTITVPATNPGTITFRYRPEGWDTGNFDPIRIDLVNGAGTVLVEMVGPTAGSYATKPFGPNNGNAQASNTTSGYRQYNGFDCTLTGTHLLGMTVPCSSEPWFTVTQSLAAYAGTTITFRMRVFSDAADKSWYHLDNVEWSVVAATLGAPEGFGVNITAPVAGSNFAPGQIVPITAAVDAGPTAATNPVTVSVLDNSGAIIQSGITLFNDATHGDAVAGDSIWSNNGSVPAQPGFIVPLSAVTSTGWTMRVFARDATNSTVSAQNGLIRGPGSGAAAETQANFWNIDDVTFNIQGAAITIAKSSTIISDPSNGVTNPKMIPGATVRYCLLVSNAGPASAGNIIVTDALPTQMQFVPGSMRSGTTCAGAATVEDDDNVGADESDPFGASFSSGTLITISTALGNGASLALTFDGVIR